MRRLSLRNKLVIYIRRAYHSLFFPAFIVLVVILIVTFWAARTASVSLERNLYSGMEAQATVVQRAISVRLQGNEQLLKGIAAMFQASGTVSEGEWNTYINASDMEGRFTARDLLAVAQPVSGGSLHVLYTTPGESVPAAGSDLSKAKDYSALYDAAKSSKRIAMSPDDTRKDSLLIGMPFYEPGDPLREVPSGFVYARLDAKELFDSVLDDSLLRGVKITVYPGTSDTAVYRSNAFGPHIATSSLQKTYYFYGHPLRVDLTFDKLSLVNKTQLDGPLLITSGGILASLLIASIVYLLLMTRARELQIEKVNDLNLAKDDLLSLASHQLRTPATGVKQYLGMVIQGYAGAVSDQQKKLLDKAYASNDRQLDVINEILHVAKIGAGRIVLAKQDTNIGDLVQDIVNEQMRDIARSKHKVTTQMPLKPIIINADAHMLRMAIENLVSNAIKYTPDGGKIKVSVVATRLNVKIAIQDSGVGISPEDFPKLFQQFSRVPNEMGFQVSGTGVGLYLAKHLVELHGGKISVASKLGEGSVFVISLPRLNIGLTGTKRV